MDTLLHGIESAKNMAKAEYKKRAVIPLIPRISERQALFNMRKESRAQNAPDYDRSGKW